MIQNSTNSTRRARELRKRATLTEEILWQRLRNRRCGGLKFRRQHPIGRYIADFYCAELKLVIELEGEVHHQPDQREYDTKRFEELELRGLKVLRLSNSEVLQNTEGVMQRVLECKMG